MKKAFTLIELLVVVAIVAVIGAGVAVYYGRDTVDDAKKQMTLHEMAQIRDAFARFWADNSAQMLHGVTVANHDTPLPNGDFAFAANDAQTYSSARPAERQRIYGAMQFFERHGLWPLMQKSVHRKSDGAQIQIFDSANEARKYEFDSPSPLTGGGWRGPYPNAVSAVECVLNNYGGYIVEAVGSDKKGITSREDVADNKIRFPQPATKFNDANGGIYRVFYYEHCADEREGFPIYRRLILMAAQNPLDYDTWNEIRVFAGNRRYAAALENLPIDRQTGTIVAYDSSLGVFFMELLNLDTVYRE